MTPDQYATAARCATCGQPAHPFMRTERITAAVFNGVARALDRVTTVGQRRPEATRD
jgi:hypothetical protein